MMKILTQPASTMSISWRTLLAWWRLFHCSFGSNGVFIWFLLPPFFWDRDKRRTTNTWNNKRNVYLKHKIRDRPRRPETSQSQTRSVLMYMPPRVMAGPDLDLTDAIPNWHEALVAATDGHYVLPEKYFLLPLRANLFLEEKWQPMTRVKCRDQA